ncbi:MAG: hypothetical protein UW41_C0009G0015 [Candidatus Collierbacteria bacterium GW2011_GWC2_44_18]|uniref:Uncharacterized protein n=2 Tax=Microgenomates group TaxID=1794810 RepID=A0A0G1J7V5_9BACT|nr:MAG: hypothetical protein UW16_C0005G0017 [Microgenomates group bacterium GW2011_GWC1_44_10]KKT49248.1 MAG: hypothetical protein UW41_C0009G0015 [Candidatus Collierbacteria bacterium GW2011_GWC2_44_18]KKT67453.1 MAG: hypothetical protein UW60_C0006G0017 [Candidatus Woesebacteria bacterium GW2011_GWA2_44_33]
MRRLPVSKTFRGHGIFAMVINVSLALIPLAYIKLIEWYLFLGIMPMVWVLAILLVWTLPHPTYLFFELKHLIHNPSIIVPRDVTAVIVFGLLSLLGLGLQILTNVSLLGLIGPTNKLVIVLSLSFFASIGGCLGLTDLVWIAGLWPPFMLEHLQKVVNNNKLIALCLGTTLLLFFLTMFFA